jgi:hypothetical protein
MKVSIVLDVEPVVDATKVGPPAHEGQEMVSPAPDKWNGQRPSLETVRDRVRGLIDDGQAGRQESYVISNVELRSRL